MDYKKSFSLIELLVVVFIIGVLAGIIVVSMSGATNSANDVRRKSDLHQLVSAILRIKIQDGVLPSETNNNCKLGSSNSSENCSGIQTKLSSLGVSIPKDPVSSDYYIYNKMINDGFALKATMSDSSVYSYSSIGNNYFINNPLVDWTRKRAIAITNTSGNNLTDYQVPFDINYDSDMQIDFDDLRFTASDKTTILNYWVESKTNSSIAKVWVKIPSIPTTGTTVYVYYGNSAVSSASTFGIFNTISNWSAVTWRKSQHSTCPWSGGWESLGYNDSLWTIANNPNFISACDYCDVYARLKFMLPSTTTGTFSVSSDDEHGVYINGVTIYDGGCRVSATEDRNYSQSFVIGENILALHGSEYAGDEYLGISNISISGAATRTYSAIEPTVSIGSEE